MTKLLLVILLALIAAAPARADGPRRVADFGFDWRFHLGDVPAATDADFDDGEWRLLDVPHDWSIEGAYREDAPMGRRGGFLPAGVGWYRKSFDFDPAWKGRRVSVEFDGVYQNATVWINGHDLGTRPYGYIGFSHDLTPHLREGRNVLAVRVDHEKTPSGRWYTGSGIYCQVRLVVTDPLHVPQWGVYVATPRVDDASADVRVAATVRNDGDAATATTVDLVLFDGDGEVVSAGQADAGAVPPGESVECAATLSLPEPRLWSPASPHLYRLVTRVRADGRIVDEVTTRLGVRTIAFDAQAGFSINGVPTKIRGAAMHHDGGGATGAAVPRDVLARRLRLLKEMGPTPSAPPTRRRPRSSTTSVTRSA